MGRAEGHLPKLENLQAEGHPDPGVLPHSPLSETRTRAWVLERLLYQLLGVWVSVSLLCQLSPAPKVEALFSGLRYLGAVYEFLIKLRCVSSLDLASLLNELERGGRGSPREVLGKS